MSYTGRIAQILLETEPWRSLPAQSCYVFWDTLYSVAYIWNISNLMREPHCPGLEAMLQQQQQCWCPCPPGRAAAVEQLGSKTSTGTRLVPPKAISAYSNATYVPRHAKLSETLICQQSSVYTSALPAVGELISFHTLELHWQRSVGYAKPQSAGHVCIRFVGLHLILCIKGSWTSPLSSEIIITPIVPSGHGDPVHTYPERQGIQSTPCWDRELLFRLVITCLADWKQCFLHPFQLISCLLQSLTPCFFPALCARMCICGAKNHFTSGPKSHRKKKTWVYCLSRVYLRNPNTGFADNFSYKYLNHRIQAECEEHWHQLETSQHQAALEVQPLSAACHQHQARGQPISEHSQISWINLNLLCQLHKPTRHTAGWVDTAFSLP